MKLSEKLKNYRDDRPDECTMDEFHREAIALENKITTMNDQLKMDDEL